MNFDHDPSLHISVIFVLTFFKWNTLYEKHCIKQTFSDEDFTLVGNGLCRGKDWQIEGLWPKDEGIETFDRCALECKKDQACTAFDVSPSEKKDFFQCHHFGHDKVTATNSVSLRGKCYKMKGRKAIRNARPKVAFEKGSKNYKLLGKLSKEIIITKERSRGCIQHSVEI